MLLNLAFKCMISFLTRHLDDEHMSWIKEKLKSIFLKKIVKTHALLYIRVGSNCPYCNKYLTEAKIEQVVPLL